MTLNNPLPGIIDRPHHQALLYGNLVGGLDVTVAYANNKVVAWNTITVGSWLAKCQRYFDFKSDMFSRFVN